MKNTVFIGPDIDILSCPTSTPVSNTAVTLPMEKERYLIFPIRKPVRVTLLIALLLSYSPGETVGLFSGSQTCSALMGVGGDAISRLPLADAIKDRELSIIPVCYAVTYIYGTLGTVIILANFGPKLLGGLEKIRRQTKELEAKLDENSWESDPACVNALSPWSCTMYSRRPHSTAVSPLCIMRSALAAYIRLPDFMRST